MTIGILSLGAFGVALVPAIVEDALDDSSTTLASFCLAGALASPALALLLLRRARPEVLTALGSVVAPVGAFIVLLGVAEGVPVLLFAGFTTLGAAAGARASAGYSRSRGGWQHRKIERG